MKNIKMPSAYTIVTIALLITAFLTYIIPYSVIDPKTSEVVVGAILDSEGNVIRNVGTQPVGLWSILKAPIIGFQQSSDVGIAILIAGGFLGVLNYVGALQVGVSKLNSTFKGTLLIALMTLFSAILGTVFGFAEEIPAFIIVIVPMFVLAGYDVMTGLGVLFVGASIGAMSAIVNPFATGTAYAVIGNENLSLGSGIVLRIIIFISLYIISTIILIRYANKVKKNPETSILYNVPDVKTLVNENTEDLPLTKQRLASLFLFIAIVAMLIIGYVPWSEFQIGDTNLFNFINSPLLMLSNIPILGSILGFSEITPMGDWFFNELSLIFLLGAIILKFINKLTEKEFLDAFLNGAKDILGIVLILALARGVSVIMGGSSEGISLTLVYWISNGLADAPVWIFTIFGVLSFAAIGIFLQSTSSVAGISMPILGAVAFAIFSTSPMGGEIGQIILVSAYNVGLSFTIWLYPGGVILGTLAMVNVPYIYYAKFMLRFLIPMLIIGTFIVFIAPYINLI